LLKILWISSNAVPLRRKKRIIIEGKGGRYKKEVGIKGGNEKNSIMNKKLGISVGIIAIVAILAVFFLGQVTGRTPAPALVPTPSPSSVSIPGIVQSKRPAKITEIAKAINIAPETIEKHIEALGMVKDANGKVYSDRNSMSAMRLEEWKKKREVVIKKWSEIAEKNPGLTQEELKEIYIRHYPDDEDIGRYLEEREEGAKTKVISPSTAKIIRYEKRYNGSNCVLCILLCIGVIPGLLYYLLARETIPIYEGDEE